MSDSSRRGSLALFRSGGRLQGRLIDKWAPVKWFSRHLDATPATLAPPFLDRDSADPLITAAQPLPGSAFPARSAELALVRPPNIVEASPAWQLLELGVWLFLLATVGFLAGARLANRPLQFAAHPRSTTRVAKPSPSVAPGPIAPQSLELAQADATLPPLPIRTTPVRNSVPLESTLPAPEPVSPEPVPAIETVTPEPPLAPESVIQEPVPAQVSVPDELFLADADDAELPEPPGEPGTTVAEIRVVVDSGLAATRRHLTREVDRTRTVLRTGVDAVVRLQSTARSQRAAPALIPVAAVVPPAPRQSRTATIIVRLPTERAELVVRGPVGRGNPDEWYGSRVESFTTPPMIFETRGVCLIGRILDRCERPAVHHVRTQSLLVTTGLRLYEVDLRSASPDRRWRSLSRRSPDRSPSLDGFNFSSYPIFQP